MADAVHNGRWALALQIDKGKTMDGIRTRSLVVGVIVLTSVALTFRRVRQVSDDSSEPQIPLLSFQAAQPSPVAGAGADESLIQVAATARSVALGPPAAGPVDAGEPIPKAWIHLPETSEPLQGWIVFYRHGCSNRFFTSPHVLELAAELRLGLVQFLPSKPAPEPGVTGAELLMRLADIAAQHNRPELAEAPLVLVGQSGAFNWGMSLAAEHPHRVLSVIGFRTGAWPMQRYSPDPFRNLPVLVLAGELDEAHRIADTLRLVEWARDQHLPMTVLHQRGGHHASPDVADEGIPVILEWLRAVVPPSLDAYGSDEAVCWLGCDDERWGDVQTLNVSHDPLEQEVGDVTTWLPNADFAETWSRDSVPYSSERIPRDVLESRRRRSQRMVLAEPIRWGTEPVWPCWRGQQSNGHGEGPEPMTKWSESEGVLWKAPLPGLGHSSPVVVNGRVFLTAVDDSEQVHLLCLDAQQGRLVWDSVLAQGNLGDKHARNSFASATVACDGERLLTAYVHQETLWLNATDWDGRPCWQQAVGPFATTHGYGASPTLYGGLVIVSGEQQPEGTLAAYRRDTGELVWKVSRTGAPSCGSPVVAHLAGRDQLLLAGDRRTIAYDPLTGSILWECAGPSRLVCNSIAFDDRTVFVSGGHPEEKLLAIRADGRGDVTSTHIEWELDKGTTYVPSPLVVDDRLLVVNDLGVAIWMRTDDGKVVWKKRLGGRFSSSPVLCNNRIYATNDAGKTFVCEASDEYTLIAENELSGEVLATPAIVGGRIYLRTMTDLYCLGRASQIAEHSPVAVSK